MVDLLLALTGILLIATVGAAVEYYRHVRKAQKEYERARGAVEDIVLSFNRELKREANMLEVLAFKMEGIASKAESSIQKADSSERKVESIEESAQSIIEYNTNILDQMTVINTKIREVKESHDALGVKVTALDEQLQKATAVPEVRSMPVIPIKKDKAIAALTETELTVLDMLFKEGPRTAPEIKERVQLSREHTARLMKKLYEKGYLERETGKIPFKYSLKKEMKKILKKPEMEQA